VRSSLPPPLFLLLLLSSCLSYQEVTFQGITDVDVSKFDQAGVAARVTVTLDNPNSFRIHVKDPQVDLYLNEVYIGKALLDGGQAMGAMLAAALTGKARLKAKGSVVGRAFLLRKRFPFEEEHDFEWEY
jgi:hypothetical protein